MKSFIPDVMDRPPDHPNMSLDDRETNDRMGHHNDPALTQERRFSDDAADPAASIGYISAPSASPLREGLLSGHGLRGVARRTLGICLLLVTVCLWTLSNFLASVCLPSLTIRLVETVRLTRLVVYLFRPYLRQALLPCLRE